ncbi:hypothetical protein FQN51_009303 [Onygenales sp. PD_10]|nr:hypothetical protein FQN51_009303 [Onygenales sp. PD_10]
MTSPFSRVRATATDGRMRNVYWRQDQLQKLHAALVDHGCEIQDVIRQETGNTIAEARVEYLLALSSVKELYSSLDPKKELRDEYNTANDIDIPNGWQPAGLVYIEPTSYTVFYSVLSPLAAAIASGNCVIVKVPDDLRETTKLLRKLLLQALDSDILNVIQTDVPASDLPTGVIRVLQSGSPGQAKPADLISPSTARTIAVVDRTANLDNAAKALVAARFAFRGKSPYAPDIVLVNDFVIERFLAAVTQHWIHIRSQLNPGPDAQKNSQPKPGWDAGLLAELQKYEEPNLICSDSRGTVIELKQRHSSLITRKVSRPLLLVHAVSSLDDAIDLANSNDTLLAAYHFADNPSCKYLGQFINSEVAFANHIPGGILGDPSPSPSLGVGPAAPVGHAVTMNFRYNPSLFTVPRPRYINCHAQSALIGSTLLEQQNHPELAKWEADARSLPIDTKRSTGEMLGFFEQGIVTGASVLFTVIFAGVGIAVYHGTQLWRMR